MTTATFEYNGATFRVNEDTVGVGVDAEMILYMLYPEPTPRQIRHGLDYGKFVATVELVDGDAEQAFGALLPKPDSPVNEIVAFYGVYERLPRAFRNGYTGAQAKLYAASNAPNLTPEVDSKKKTTGDTEAADTSSFEASTETSTPLPEGVSD